MTSTATDSKPRTADEMTAWLSGKLRQIQAGWPQHLVLDGSGADSQAAWIIRALPAAAKQSGFAYLSLDQPSPMAHPLEHLTERFLTLADRSGQVLVPRDQHNPYLRFAGAVSAACRTQVRPILISMTDADAVRRHPDGINILSALRAALNEAQGSISALFLLRTSEGRGQFLADALSPFYGFATPLHLRTELG